MYYIDSSADAPYTTDVLSLHNLSKELSYLKDGAEGFSIPFVYFTSANSRFGLHREEYNVPALNLRFPHTEGNITVVVTIFTNSALYYCI